MQEQSKITTPMGKVVYSRCLENLILSRSKAHGVHVLVDLGPSILEAYRWTRTSLLVRWVHFPR